MQKLEAFVVKVVEVHLISDKVEKILHSLMNQRWSNQIASRDRWYKTFPRKCSVIFFVHQPASHFENLWRPKVRGVKQKVLCWLIVASFYWGWSFLTSLGILQWEGSPFPCVLSDVWHHLPWHISYTHSWHARCALAAGRHWPNFGQPFSLCLAESCFNGMALRLFPETEVQVPKYVTCSFSMIHISPPPIIFSSGYLLFSFSPNETATSWHSRRGWKIKKLDAHENGEKTRQQMAFLFSEGLEREDEFGGEEHRERPFKNTESHVVAVESLEHLRKKQPYSVQTQIPWNWPTAGDLNHEELILSYLLVTTKLDRLVGHWFFKGLSKNWATCCVKMVKFPRNQRSFLCQECKNEQNKHLPKFHWRRGCWWC